MADYNARGEVVCHFCPRLATHACFAYDSHKGMGTCSRHLCPECRPVTIVEVEETEEQEEQHEEPTEQ